LNFVDNDKPVVLAQFLTDETRVRREPAEFAAEQQVVDPVRLELVPNVLGFSGASRAEQQDAFRLQGLRDRAEEAVDVHFPSGKTGIYYADFTLK
jgi:hypothetical protein